MTPSSGSGPKKRRLRIVPLSLGLLLALVIAVFGYYWVVVQPWTTPPDASDREIAALWEDVERRAVVPVEATGPSHELARLLRQLEDAADLESTVTEWREKGRIDDIGRSALEAERDIGERLVGWMKADGGFGKVGPCVADEDFPPLRLMALGETALAMAGVLEGGPATPERLRSVLHLARVMRRGGGPLQLMAGLRLAEHVAAVAKRMDALAVLRGLPEYAPVEEEIWRAANAEAFCADEILERHFGGLSKRWPKESPATRGVPRSWIGIEPAFFRRERAMVRWWHGQRLADAAPAALDPPRLAEALRLPDDLDSLPKSLLVRMMAVDLAGPVGEGGQVIEAYREAVGLPRP